VTAVTLVEFFGYRMSQDDVDEVMSVRIGGDGMWRRRYFLNGMNQVAVIANTQCGVGCFARIQTVDTEF